MYIFLKFIRQQEIWRIEQIETQKKKKKKTWHLHFDFESL